MSTQTADVLDAARDLLDREGWRQGRQGKGKVGRCSGEAIAYADSRQDGPPHYIDARLALAAVIGGRSLLAPSEVALEGWNDAPGRRVSEVLDAFTAAAAHERGAA
jgi:hypothetical protein